MTEIFHYTKCKTALENILVEKRLRLSRLGKTNDPRESQLWNIPTPYWIGVQNDHEALLDALTIKAIDEVKRIIKEDWKVLCFTLNRSDTAETITNPLEETYHFHLCPGYARPQLWAHYAENHQGVCLLFDSDRLDQSLQQKFNGHKITHDKVEYGTSWLPPFPRDLRNEIESLGLDKAAWNYVVTHEYFFFLRKYLEWSNETEYRWLVHSPGTAEEYVSIEDSIKAVFVGVDFPKVYEPSLVALCKELQIPANKLIWNNGVPETHFETIYDPYQ